MLNFEKLVEDYSHNRDRAEDYFSEFFTKANFKEYELAENIDSNGKKAVKMMFESRKNLLKRADDAFRCDPFCIEAFFVYYTLSDDIYVNMRCESFYEEAEKFADFSIYQKVSYIHILDFYVEFLLDIHNFTGAIRVLRMILRLTKDGNPRNINRLSFIYGLLEEDKDFYRLYLDYDFDAYDYLILLVTLLKHEDVDKAKEVLLDMYEKIEPSKYLDHLWDLDENNEAHSDFLKCVEDCFDFINSYPGFFSWINMTNESLQQVYNGTMNEFKKIDISEVENIRDTLDQMQEDDIVYLMKGEDEQYAIMTVEYFRLLEEVSLILTQGPKIDIQGNPDFELTYDQYERVKNIVLDLLEQTFMPKPENLN